MSKKESSELKETLDAEQLDSVLGGASLDLSNLSNFQVARASNIRPLDPGLLDGFQEPLVRSSERLRVVNPDWVSDSISVEVACVGWSKDYDDPPPEPEPKDPDGGTGGGGGAPGRYEAYDLEDIDLSGIDPFGRGGGLIRR